MKMFTQTSHADCYTHVATFDCTQQGIHYCFHESMGKCTPTTYGHECCLHNGIWVNAHPWWGYVHECCLYNRVWVNANPWCTATNVAFTTESGWMHTHDVRPQMLPSQQSLGECTPMMYGHECCLHNRVWVNAHPWCTATNVAFITETGLRHTHDIWPRMLPSLKVRVPAHPRHTPHEFLGDIRRRLKWANLQMALFWHYFDIKN